MVHWDEEWAEAFTLIFLFIGFVISILLQSAVLSYISVLLAGGMAGRIYYVKKLREPIFPFILMIVGFLVGYLIGNFWTSRFWTLVYFSLGFSASLYLHRKKIFVTFKSQNFVR